MPRDVQPVNRQDYFLLIPQADLSAWVDSACVISIMQILARPYLIVDTATLGRHGNATFCDTVFLCISL